MSKEYKHIPAVHGLAKYPNWTVIPAAFPIEYVHADHRVNVDTSGPAGTARIQIKPGYDLASIAEIRYQCVGQR